MRKLFILGLITIVALEKMSIAGVFAFEWKSSSLFPNGTVVQACIGDNVTFPWVLDITSSTQVSIQWIKPSKDQPKVVALYSGDTFYQLEAERILKFLPNAGIMLPNVTLEDIGYYSVEVFERADLKLYKQSAFLQVFNVPLTASKEMQPFILPENVYNYSTGQWHVQIGCRPPVIQGLPTLPVIWTMPSNRTVQCTSYNNNTSILILSNPLEEGDYSCSLDPSAPAVRCFRSLTRNSTVNVKRLNTRVSLLEESVEVLKTEMGNLTAPLSHLSDVVQQLEVNEKKIVDDLKNTAGNKSENISSSLGILQTKFDNLAQFALLLQGIMRPLKDPFGLSLVPSKDDMERKPASCNDVMIYDKVSGIHTLFLSDYRIVKVYCDQTTDNGGWTVFQRRQDGSVDFYRNWEQYEKGFGDLNKEFWIGLDNLYQLTKSKNFKLRVDLTDFKGSTIYAVYSTFSINGPEDNYRLNVAGYSGTAGDGLTGHKNLQFSTYDRDHDTWSGGNCALKWTGGWWYEACHPSCLNGVYKPDGAPGYDGIVWSKWKSDWQSFKRVEMKFKL